MKASWQKQRLCRRQNLTTWLYPQVVSFNSTRIRNFQWEGHERPRSNKLLCGFSNIFFRILKRWISVSGEGHERNHSKNKYRIEETKQQRLNIVSPAVFSSFSFSHNFPLLHHVEHWNATNLTENFFQQLEALW